MGMGNGILVISYRLSSLHVAHLEDTFHMLRRYQMKLSPTKCTFEVESDKFVSFMVNQQGIEVNSKKSKALINMKSPTKLREVQQLTGWVATLNRFISKATDWRLLFFKAIKKKTGDILTKECEKEFHDLKKSWVDPPHINPKRRGEPIGLSLCFGAHDDLRTCNRGSRGTTTGLLNQQSLSRRKSMVLRGGKSCFGSGYHEEEAETILYGPQDCRLNKSTFKENPETTKRCGKVSRMRH